ncbi:exopolysaccharide biosynthesis protein [Mesorhizobium sp. Z1-4]|uniref:exopolysaccharide biosynthesis protein n=1 Tax=Mesorhizobium sp. Z1-4 TaxID=2448478 RepID=UPI000FD748E7|nr:exopolysaccharide biosynthesis protein [Mesorhizobium sp. Z1-4]
MTGTNLVYRKPPRRLSQVLRQLADSSDGPVTVAMIRDALGDRSYAALLVFCASLNLLPLPPGSTLLFGPPLILLTVQMVAGYETVWLPRSWLNRSVGHERFRGMIDRLLPKLERLERLVKPRRWPFVSAKTSDRVIGALGLVLSIAVTLPIPLGNWLPAFAVAIIGLSLSERDGVFLALGTAVGIVSLLIIATVIGAAGAMAALFFSGL